jgi:hypothetical protein
MRGTGVMCGFTPDGGGAVLQGLAKGEAHGTACGAGRALPAVGAL